MQAEVEAFAEEIQAREQMSEDEDSEDANTVRGSGSEDEHGSPSKTSKKNRKRRSLKEKGDGDAKSLLDPVVDLATEYSFISVISYFLRAIASSAIDARHSAVLLAYYGRLGTQFDHCLSTIITVLREEGMYKKNGSLIEHVICEALRNVCSSITSLFLIAIASY